MASSCTRDTATNKSTLGVRVLISTARHRPEPESDATVVTVSWRPGPVESTEGVWGACPWAPRGLTKASRWPLDTVAT